MQTAPAAARLVRLCEQHTRAVLTCVLLLALGLRALALWSLSTSPYGAQLMPDEQVYDAWARLLLEGQPAPHVVDFPGVPARVFALLYAAFGASSSVIRAFNLVLGTATCAVMYVPGAALGGRAAGLLSALLCAVYGPLVLASVTAHNTALGVFGFACMLAVAARCFARPSPALAGALGAAIAVATWMRPNTIALAVVALGWIVGSGLRARVAPRAIGVRAAAFVAGLALLVVPGREAALPEPAFNLFIANTLDNPTPYFRPVRFASSEPSKQALGFVVEASVHEGRALSLAEARDYFSAELAREWRARPAAALSKLATKLGASLHTYEAANNHNLAFLRRVVPGLALPYASFALLLALAALAVPRALRTNAVARGLLALAAAYLVTLIAFFADTRVRAPLALALMPFAALGIHALISAVAERDRARGWRSAGIAVAVFAGSSWLPVPGAGDLSTAYNFHALFLLDAGELQQATAYYRASSALAGSDSASAYLGLSAIAEREGDLDTATRELSRIPDAHYKAAEKYLRLGSLLVRQHQFAAAAAAFEQSLRINPNNLALYPLLITLHERLHAPAAAAELKHRYALVSAVHE